MPNTVNPYNPGQPVDNSDLFFGRRDLLASFREHLLQGRRVFVVSGGRRMGKSSFLRQLPNSLPEEFLTVRLDLADEEDYGRQRLPGRLVELIWRAVEQSAGYSGQGPDLAEIRDQPRALGTEYWPEVRAALGDRRMVLLLDDLDGPSDAGEDDAESALVAVLEELLGLDGSLALVVTVSAMQEDALLRRYSRLFGGSVAYQVGPLSSEESSRLITWPVDGVLAYDFGVTRRMIEITSGQPYYLQLLCFEIFNRCATTGWVNQRDVDLVLEDLLGREIPDFRQSWHESSPPEQAALAALVSLRGARGVATSQEVRTVLNKAGARVDRAQVSLALDSLVQRGILERLGALSYRFQVALLRDWLSERVDLLQVVRSTRWDAVRSPAAGAARQVPKLPPRRGGRVKPASRDRRKPDESAQGHATPRAVWQRWMWPAIMGTALVAVLVVLGLALAGPPTSPATPVVEETVPVATRPTSAAVTALPTGAGLAASASSPTTGATMTPSQLATPSPTPPLIVARSVPSIAYQSKEPGDSEWYVHVMNSDGSDRARLAAGQSAFLSAPSWSPDGSKLVFVSDVEGQSDIWVIDVDGSNKVNLTEDEAADHSPSWSPDGHWIAFASLRDSPYWWELYVMRPDGTDVTRLTWWEDASDLSPTWSPDGTKLAFSSKRDGNWEIYTMDRDGGNLARLTNDPADDTDPAWAPDGSRIAFVSTRDGYPEIYVMSITGGQASNISNAPYSSEHGPTWSPDGGRLAFYSDRDGSWNIHVMASDGSDVIRLTGGQSNDQVPAWRP